MFRSMCTMELRCCWSNLRPKGLAQVSAKPEVVPEDVGGDANPRSVSVGPNYQGSMMGSAKRPLGLTAVGLALDHPVRSAALLALIGGQPLTATALATAAGVAPALASPHLARLRASGLVVVLRSARRHLYELADPEIAAALEGIVRATSGDERASLARARLSMTISRVGWA